MLLPAPLLLPSQWQPSPEGAMAIRVGESLHIPGWRSGGTWGYCPPNKPSPVRGHDIPNPRSCILVGGDNASFQLSTSERAQPNRASHRAPAPAMVAPDTGPCPGHNPSPHHRAADVCPPPWSSASDRALHIRQDRGKAGSSSGGRKGAGTETAGLLDQQDGAEGSPEVRASCLSMQLCGWPLGGRGWL